MQNVDLTGLAAGKRIITLTATNSMGMTGTQTIQITVQ